MPDAVDLRRMSECTLEGGHLAYESGDGVVVSLMAEVPGGVLDADNLRAQLRMEIRYEVEKLLSHRGKGAALEYHVKWAKWRETTWEPAENLVGATEALQAYHEGRKKPKKKPKLEGAEAAAEGGGEAGAAAASAGASGQGAGAPAEVKQEAAAPAAAADGAADGAAAAAADD